MNHLIKATPWDSILLGIPTWELVEYSEVALQQLKEKIGHFAIKVNPLSDKSLLHKFGFYYCDTLIEPHCNAARLRFTHHKDATISKNIKFEHVLNICKGAFTHDRFHRDFSFPNTIADLRYDTWLKQLLENQQVYGLFWKGSLAGFIGYNDSRLVLHALEKNYRGKGLSKYWWSAICRELLEQGSSSVTSSISVANLAVLNLYSSLGFIFNHPQDVYHKMKLK